MTRKDHVARTEIELPACRDDVWEALTSDSGLATWMGQEATIDPCPGGAISVPDIATGRPRDGYVEAIDPQRQLDFVWWPADDPAERSHVAIRLEPTEFGTKVVVVETLRASATSAAHACAQAAWSWRQAMCAVTLRISVS